MRMQWVERLGHNVCVCVCCERDFRNTGGAAAPCIEHAQGLETRLIGARPTHPATDGHCAMAAHIGPILLQLRIVKRQEENAPLLQLALLFTLSQEVNMCYFNL